MNITTFIGGCLLLSIAISCTPDIKTERGEIESYLASKALVPDTIIDNVFVIIEEPGDTDKPTVKESTVTLTYVGHYLDNTIFDDTRINDPVTIKLSTAIVGLAKGLTFFGRNSRGTIIIPSSRAYSNNPPKGIRKNAILIYDVVVKDF